MFRLRSYVWQDGDERERTISAAELRPGDVLGTNGFQTLDVLTFPTFERGRARVTVLESHGEEGTFSASMGESLDILRVGVTAPEGVPEDAELVELPFSEVCMHMGIAGALAWVAPLANGMAQVYRDGRTFSFPVTRGEAGIPYELAPGGAR